MSKPQKRLALKSETLRTLSGAVLDAVIGGNGNDSSVHPSMRASSVLPPQHDRPQSGHHTCHSHLCPMQTRKTVK